MNWKGFKSREVGSEANLGSWLHLLASPKIVARMQKWFTEQLGVERCINRSPAILKTYSDFQIFIHWIWIHLFFIGFRRHVIVNPNPNRNALFLTK